MELKVLFPFITKAFAGLAGLLLTAVLANLMFHTFSWIRHRENRTSVIAVTFAGNIAVIAFIGLSAFIANQYLVAQAERKNQIASLIGIDKKLDGKISNALGARVSFQYARSIELRALKECQTASSLMEPSQMRACERLLDTDKPPR